MDSLWAIVRNARTILLKPRLAVEYATWSLQRVFRPGGPTRVLCGVRIGSFNGFSEYHSVARGVSAAELKFIREFEFGDGAIIDIGANLGLFALAVRNRFPDRRVVAFEPTPSTFTALVQNVALNNASNVECHQLAVTDYVGASSFVVVEHARANSAIKVKESMSGGQRIQIQCTTLDSFVSSGDVRSIALLKVDVEGFETAVFRGASGVLSKVRPRVIYFEVCPALASAVGCAPTAAATVLQDNGYALYRLQSDGSLQSVEPRNINDVVLENWVGVDSRTTAAADKPLHLACAGDGPQ